MAHPSSRRRRPRSESEQRAELGGYSEAEFDAEFVRTQQSDVFSIGLRVVILTVVYGFLARAVASGQITAAYLWLPMAFEWLFIFWLGCMMAWFWVDWAAFQKSANRPVLAMVWTVAVVAAFAAAFAWNGEAGALSAQTLRQRGPEIAHTLRESGLVWALAACALGLLGSTIAEVLRWKRVGGVFVWTSIMGLGMRFAVLFLGGFLAAVLFGVTADIIRFDPTASPQRLAWTTYGFLLFVEIGGLVLGVAMHRDLSRKAARSA